jgi:hypoxanthine phosphoribosyltransferase
VTAGIEEATGTPRPIPREPDVAERVEQRDERRSDTVAGTRFAHASEAEMARILDFYAVRWEYEPMTFPILWNTDGDVIESFSPDFYLPDLELFLEMTTLKQRLVRKKNRKLRRLRALYPDIRIKLFYARDFRAMMLKYGRYALFDSLAGTSGQVVPERSARAQSIAEVMPDAVPDATMAPASAATVAADIEPAMPGATPRSRSARRRRRRAAAIEVGAEQESGA